MAGSTNFSDALLPQARPLFDPTILSGDNAIGQSTLNPLATQPLVSSSSLDSLDPVKLLSELPSDLSISETVDFTSGYFTVGSTGQVGIDYLFDGGGYEGELAIFSLSGLEEFATDLSTLTQEIVRRALSDTVQGYVVIRDAIEGARFSGELGEANYNSGKHLDGKTGVA